MLVLDRLELIRLLVDQVVETLIVGHHVTAVPVAVVGTCRTHGERVTPSFLLQPVVTR